MDYNTFLSWSGENSLSHNTAKLFRDWLHRFLHTCKPFLSNKDIRPGVDFASEIRETVNSCKAIIVFLTERSIKSTWLNFETGMFAANHAQVIGLELEDIMYESTPIKRNQWKKPVKEDIIDIIREINNSIIPNVEENTFLEAIERDWEEFEAQLSQILNQEEEINTLLVTGPLEFRINEGDNPLAHVNGEQQDDGRWSFHRSNNNAHNIFGPYVDLGAGKYKVTFWIEVGLVLYPDKQIAEIDVAKLIRNMHLPFRSKQLTANKIRSGEAFIEFELSEKALQVEFRFKLLNNNSVFIFSHITLETT
jgi:hypothetical protein